MTRKATEGDGKFDPYNRFLEHEVACIELIYEAFKVIGKDREPFLKFLNVEMRRRREFNKKLYEVVKTKNKDLMGVKFPLEGDDAG